MTKNSPLSPCLWSLEERISKFFLGGGRWSKCSIYIPALLFFSLSVAAVINGNENPPRMQIQVNVCYESMYPVRCQIQFPGIGEYPVFSNLYLYSFGYPVSDSCRRQMLESGLGNRAGCPTNFNISSNSVPDPHLENAEPDSPRGCDLEENFWSGYGFSSE